MYSQATARDYKHIHHILNESDGITLCDSLETESSQSKLKASAVNNEPFHKNWKLYKATWLLLRVTRANDKTGIYTPLYGFYTRKGKVFPVHAGM
jgi:hypothetical protein